MRVAIVGAEGQLGQDAGDAFINAGHQVFRLKHQNMEVSDIDSVATVLRHLKANMIVNVAAMHHVERCEQDPKLAFAINALGPRNLGMVASDLGAMLMHVSTDYVFDGGKKTPYNENDLPGPLNTYGNTKLAGEYYARCTVDRHIILRTSGLYGKHPCRGKGGLNFVDLMLKLGRERGKVRVVASEEISPTSTRELARQMVVLSQGSSFGLFHATAEGSCTWYEFAKEIFATAKMPTTVEVADPTEFPAKVRRPSYSVLENRTLKDQGLNCFRPWQKGLQEYLASETAENTRVPIALRS